MPALLTIETISFPFLALRRLEVGMRIFPQAGSWFRGFPAQVKGVRIRFPK